MTTNVRIIKMSTKRITAAILLFSITCSAFAQNFRREIGRENNQAISLGNAEVLAEATTQNEC
jgi:hypothetical protein